MERAQTVSQAQSDQEWELSDQELDWAGNAAYSYNNPSSSCPACTQPQPVCGH